MWGRLVINWCSRKRIYIRNCSGSWRWIRTRIRDWCGGIVHSSRLMYSRIRAIGSCISMWRGLRPHRTRTGSGRHIRRNSNNRDICRGFRVVRIRNCGHSSSNSGHNSSSSMRLICRRMREESCIIIWPLSFPKSKWRRRCKCIRMRRIRRRFVRRYCRCSRKRKCRFCISISVRSVRRFNCLLCYYVFFFLLVV